jgi:chemotaxis protein methyltransferase CheR
MNAKGLDAGEPVEPGTRTDQDEIEELEVRLFLDAIHARYGYDLRGYSAMSMRRRVRVALAKSGLPHLGELQHRVLEDPRLFARVIEDLMVQVSEMFRDPSSLRTFRERVVPVLRTYPLLNIWLSGCATGEEAYSMAVLLAEEGLYDRCQIYATDISPRALEHAKQGIFPARHLATYQANYTAAGGTKDLGDYYTAAYDQIAFRASLRRNILFFQHNLVTDHVFAQMQVIFCRNVLIYFGADLRDRVLEKFAQTLVPGGFLCLGSGERLSRRGLEKFGDLAASERIYRLKG